MIGITKQQAALLQFLTRYIAKHGYAPNFAEMGEAMEIKSRGAIFGLLNGLEERGRIRRLPHKARAIEVVNDMVVTINRDVGPLIAAYAKQEKLPIDVATNELLRLALGAAA